MRSETRSRHGLDTTEAERLSQTRVVHDMPTSDLPRQNVSAHEVLQDRQLVQTRALTYEIGEDWSDD